MAKVISVANQKGGVGKTTIAMQLVFFLLLLLKKKVLVVDMDGQGNTSSRLAPFDLNEYGEREPIYSGTKTAELFADNLEQIEVLHCPCGADLIHTPKNDPDLFEMEAVDLEYALNVGRNLQPLFDQYDYVVVDCPPSLGRKLVAALSMSTHVVCPVKLSGFARDGVVGLVTTILGIQSEYNPDLDILGIVVNDMDKSSAAHARALASLEREVGDGFVLENKIMHRTPLDTATDEGTPIWETRYGHVAAKEVQAVLNEIMEKVEA